MKRLLHDENASRRFFVIFTIIGIIGATLTYFTAQDKPGISEYFGSPSIEVKNYTYYDIRIKAEVPMYYGSSSKINFSVSAGGSKDYRHNEGDITRIGRAGSQLEVYLYKAADNSHNLQFNLEFDGEEGDSFFDGIRIKRRWENRHWVLIFDETGE